MILLAFIFPTIVPCAPLYSLCSYHVHLLLPIFYIHTFIFLHPFPSPSPSVFPIPHAPACNPPRQHIAACALPLLRMARSIHTLPIYRFPPASPLSFPLQPTRQHLPEKTSLLLTRIYGRTGMSRHANHWQGHPCLRHACDMHSCFRSGRRAMCRPRRGLGSGKRRSWGTEHGGGAECVVSVRLLCTFCFLGSI